MTLRDLEYLVAVYDLRHFTRAAERCHVSQPTLSGQLLKLEDELGVSIIERSTRKVIFTRLGTEIAEQAREVLFEAEKLKSLARAASDPFAGEIHLGLIPTVGPYLLPMVMNHLKHCFPGLEFFLHELRTDQILEKLAIGELDAGLLARMDGMQSFPSHSLYEEDLLLAAPQGHPLLSRKSITRENLAGETVLMLEDGHCLRDQAMGVCFAAGAEEDKHYQATSLDTLRYMVGAGTGITLMPRFATLRDEVDGIEYREFAAPRPSREIILVYRDTTPGEPVLHAIAAEISAQVKEAGAER